MARSEDRLGATAREGRRVRTPGTDRPEQNEAVAGTDLLDDLLLQSPDNALNRRSASPLVLFGAGNLGREVLARLRRAGIEPVAFADDTASKKNSVIDGLPVISPEKAVARFGRNTRFAVTILNSRLAFVEARRQLATRTGCEILSFLALARMYPDQLLPYLQYAQPARILENTPQIRRLFGALADQESRRQFLSHLQFRLAADYECLPARSEPAYFPPDLIGSFPKNITFVDCGAFDGDTIRNFLAHQGDDFATILAFEPDIQNHARLDAFVRSLSPELSSRIWIYRGAVGDHRGSIAFNQTGDMSAAISPDAAEKADLFKLDDLVPKSAAPVYLKLDVEGFEMEALQGAKALLSSGRATLAVSIYHRPEDLWEIPLHLHDFGLGYRLYLRTEGLDGMDLVCYALPANLATPA
jgi:FkbM family methyltransferase